jgi:tetratricopeptide (TPR) repeat protein
LDRRDEALKAAQEAVKHFETLAKGNPDALLPPLTMALNNLGIHLSSLGRREEALNAMQEAVKHYEALAKANPDAFRPDLARSLAVLGHIQRQRTDHASSRDSLAEGLRILLPFYQRLPDAHEELFNLLLTSLLLTSLLLTSLETTCPIPDDLREWTDTTGSEFV